MFSYTPSLEIDLSIIRQNYKNICRLCRNSIVSAVVKGNAYGLGDDYVSSTLEKAGCRDFFVFSIAEGKKVQNYVKSNAKIYVLSGEFVDDSLIPVINHLGQLEICRRYAAKSGKKIDCILHIDVGMNRLGMPAYEVEELVKNSELLSGLNILYIISHLSSSEEQDNIENKKQLERFINMTTSFVGVSRSFANSSGIFLGSEYHFDLVRPGAALYGINSANYQDVVIKNPVILKAPIIQLQKIVPKTQVGYNGTYTAKDITNIATIPIGYADGYSRFLSNKGVVYINNVAVPVIGRVSMDLVTLDVSHIPDSDLYLGQKVEVIGDKNTPDMIAQKIKTIGYEITSMLGSRYKVIYKNK